jgi:putative resolvase
LNTGVYQPNSTESTGIAAIYGRVSASKQKKDLQTQTSALSQQAQLDGFTPKIYTDIGSGLNDKRPRFLRLLIDAIHRKFDRIYITYRDRLARFGTHSYEEIFRSLQIPIICIREDSDCSLESKLVNDVIALITSFAGKLHRSRRGKIANN